MARTKNRPAAPSAAHAAPPPAPAPGAALVPGSPAAAVHAALAGNPAATTAIIAAAAGIGRPAAREALTTMEKAGTVTRVKGGKPGVPDTWTLADTSPAGTSPAGAGPAPDPDDEHDGQPGDSTDDSTEDASQDEAACGTAPDDTDGTPGPAPQDGAGAPDPGTEQSGPHADPGAGDHDAAVPCARDDEAVPDGDVPQDPKGQDESDVPHDQDAAPANGDGQASGAPDPALVTRITERIGQIKAAADAAAIVVTGNLRAALAGLDEIHEQAAQGRREIKAAIGGRTAPAARPGGLREKVAAHLNAHPDVQFTPHEIHKVLGNSSGAIANALDTLVKLGDAELATEKPRRFRRAPATAPAAPASAGERDSAADGTKLAGAA